MDSNKKKIFFTLLMIGTFANMDKGMVGLTVKELISQYGWSASDAGLILSIFYVSFILAGSLTVSAIVSLLFSPFLF